MRAHICWHTVFNMLCKLTTSPCTSRSHNTSPPIGRLISCSFTDTPSASLASGPVFCWGHSTSWASVSGLVRQHSWPLTLWVNSLSHAQRTQATNRPIRGGVGLVLQADQLVHNNKVQEFDLFSPLLSVFFCQQSTTMCVKTNDIQLYDRHKLWLLRQLICSPLQFRTWGVRSAGCLYQQSCSACIHQNSPSLPAVTEDTPSYWLSSGRVALSADLLSAHCRASAAKCSTTKHGSLLETCYKSGTHSPS